MRFWFDVLTPKQVNFFKPVVDELRERKHDVLCTTRNYREVNELAKVKNFDLLVVGEHGGESVLSKLHASAERVEKLIDVIENFKPDSLISLASPEASRVAFGLGIKHLGFCDAPHAEAVCRLSIPLMNMLMCPSIIPVKEFTKYGINSKQLIRYRALDPAMWLRDGIKPIYTHSGLGLDASKKTITFRFEESQAAYLHGMDKSLSFKMLRSLVDSFRDSNIVILSRYTDQINVLKREFANQIVIENVIDGTSLLMLSDLFVGSGGTMNWECALLGIPNVSYTPMKYHINEYLIKKGLITRCRDAKTLAKIANKMLFDASYIKSLKRKSKSETSKMEDLKKRTIKVLESRVN